MRRYLRFRDPDYAEPTQRSAFTTCEGVEKWYAPVLLTASMIGARALRAETIQRVLDLYGRISHDEYVTTLSHFYAFGLARYGAEWHYCDLVTLLAATCELIRPQTYMEIGVRRGRSMAVVAAAEPHCHLVGFDNWKAGYAGMENPGPEFVEAEMTRLGYSGCLELVSGNSHDTVPAFIKAHPNLWFDLITVDGDHTPGGAAEDLATVLPRLKVGGALLFDDISHPAHPELQGVWDSLLGDRLRFSSWGYTDLGYGVAVAVRKV